MNPKIKNTMKLLSLTHISASDFEALRGDLSTDTIYQVGSLGDTFAWSPDGLGAYWFDTIEEAEADFEPSEQG